MPTRRHDAGFTLLEVVVAMAILAVVVLSFLGMRTEAIANASEARNWRLARELAQELMSEMQAGARDVPPTPGRVPSDRYEDFEYEIIVGEDRISRWESTSASRFGLDAHTDRNRRLAWQEERDDFRQARQMGMSLQAYREYEFRREIQEEREQKVPDEEDLEDVLIVVYFPNVRLDSEQKESHFKLKAKLSTLAIEGLTPEEAEMLARARGQGEGQGQGQGQGGQGPGAGGGGRGAGAGGGQGGGGPATGATSATGLSGR